METRETKPASALAALNLPPTFVTDHCVRTLSYRGAMSPVELARHWRVHPDIAVEVVATLRAAGLVETEASQATYERLGRIRLTATGQSYVSTARARTWYAGPLPVSLDEFEQSAADSAAIVNPASIRQALAEFAFEEPQLDEVGQALAAGATLTLCGAAWDEQATIARALRGALQGTTTLPFAIYASGAVIRLFDGRVHQPAAREHGADDAPAILRTHDTESPWVAVTRPLVTLTGGVLASDVLPAHDEDARFYLAPAPFAASGGVLAILDAGSDPDAIGELARLWLIPGRQRCGIMLLRSGERIEVPWRAATVLFATRAEALPALVRDATAYGIDITEVSAEAMLSLIEARLGADAALASAAAEPVAAGLLIAGASTRAAAAAACRYLLDRRAYQGAGFSVTPAVIKRAVEFAGAVTPGRARLAAVPVDYRPRAA